MELARPWITQRSIFPVILWLNSFKWTLSLWAAAQVLAVSIVYRSSELVRWIAERWNGALELVQGERRYHKCTSVQQAKRVTHTDMGKLDPERAIAGGKVLVLLPRLQVRQHPSDWPQNHKHAHMVTFRNAKEQPGTHSHSHKQMHACWATHKCHGCTLRLWVEFRWCHPPFRSLSLVRWQNYADAETDLFASIKSVNWITSTAPFDAV